MNLAPIYLYLLTLSEHQKAEVLSDQLYTSVVTGDFDNAVTMAVLIDKSNGTVIKDVVDKLFDNNMDNIIQFAYKLWTCGGKDVITNHFPESFRLIFSEEYLKIVSKNYELALKLAIATDSVHDRRAWGDATDNSSNRVSWKFIPIWESDQLYFKIVNIDQNQYLKLMAAESVGGHREAWGADQAHDDRHQWYLRPVKHEGEFLFYIFNRQYNQALILDKNEDTDGDRGLWGYRGYVDDSQQYGWSILRF